jgi:hypothetical protein
MYDELHIQRKEIREKLSELCVKVLSAYRANCASSTSPGQLILPEAYKLLPVYVAALLRSKALRGGKFFDSTMPCIYENTDHFSRNQWVMTLPRMLEYLT